MVEKSVLTQLSNHVLHRQVPMGLEPFMLVLANHQLLILLVGQSIDNKKHLVERRSNSQVDVINQ
jgi:hypothetical protein